MGSSIRSRGGPAAVGNDLPFTRRDMFGLAAPGAIATMPCPARVAASVNELIHGAHIWLAPSWFDPAETLVINTPWGHPSVSPSFGRIARFPYTAPYQELTQKNS